MTEYVYLFFILRVFSAHSRVAFVTIWGKKNRQVIWSNLYSTGVKNKANDLSSYLDAFKSRLLGENGGFRVFFARRKH